VAGDDGLGQAEPPLELTLFFVVQILLQRRRHDHLDAHQPLRLGPTDQPTGRRTGDAEPGSDLRLRQPIEVVERRRAQRESQILGRGNRGADGAGRLAVRRRCRHEFHPAFPFEW
jgi:hypothetical protein